MTKSYDIGGIPSDTLDSDVVGERNYKVSVKDSEELISFLAKSLSRITDQNSVIIKQLCLISTILEEMGETGINIKDIEGEDL